MGGMAFPSASEPNPVAQGIRGKGPETINYSPSPGAPPGAPPANPNTPPSNPASAYGGPYLFQDFTGQGQGQGASVDVLQNGQLSVLPWSQVANQAQYAGFGSNYSGLPTLSPQDMTTLGLNYTTPNNNYQYPQSSVFGSPSNILANYNPSAPGLANYGPQFQPYSPYNPNVSQALGQPYSANNVNQFGYTNYQKSGYQPGVY